MTTSTSLPNFESIIRSTNGHYNTEPLEIFLNYPLPGIDPTTNELLGIIDNIIKLAGYSSLWRDYIFSYSTHSLSTLQRIMYWLTIPAFRDDGSMIYSLIVLYWHTCEALVNIQPSVPVTDILLEDVIFCGELLFECTTHFQSSIAKDIIWSQLRLCSALLSLCRGTKNQSIPVTTGTIWDTMKTTSLPLFSSSNQYTTNNNINNNPLYTIRNRFEIKLLYTIGLQLGIQNLSMYIGSGVANVHFPGASIAEEARLLLITLRERNTYHSAYIVARECIQYLQNKGSTIRGTTALLAIIRDCLVYEEVATLLNMENGLRPLLTILENNSESAYQLMNSYHIERPIDISLPSATLYYFTIPSICEHGCACLLNLCVRDTVNKYITINDIKRILRIAIACLIWYYKQSNICELALRIIIHPCLIHKLYNLLSTEIAVQMGIIPIFTQIIKFYSVRKHNLIHIYIAEAIELMCNSPGLCCGLPGSIKTLLEIWIENIRGTVSSEGNIPNTNTTNTTQPMTNESSSVSELVYTKLGKIGTKLLAYADTPEYTAIATDISPDLQIPITDIPSNWRDTVLEFGMALEDAFMP